MPSHVSSATARADPAQYVLVVDDDESVRAAISRALEYAGHAVVAVGDGRAALAALDNRRPRLVVLDVMMPEMDGATFVQELERRRLRPGLPILLISANRDGQQRAADMGTEGFLAKPLQLPTLLKEVARIIAG